MAAPTRPAPETAPATLRLDVWLWHARFCRTRGVAQELCESGRIRIDGQRIEKSSRAVRVGDVLTFPLAGHVRVVRVEGLGTRRGPAEEARTLYRDLAPPETETRLPLD